MLLLLISGCLVGIFVGLYSLWLCKKDTKNQDIEFDNLATGIENRGRQQFKGYQE